MSTTAQTKIKFPLFETVTVALYVFLYAPIGVFILFAFNDADTVSLWQGFTFRWFGVAIANEALQSAAINTLVVAFSATIIALLLSVPAALATHSSNLNSRFSRRYLSCVSLPLITPEIVLGIALLSFFRLANINLGLGNVIIAHVVFCLPFAYLPILSRMRSIDISILEAADDLYAGRWNRFRLVILPLLLPGITSGAMLAFIVSFDNFIISFMVAGAGGTTLPMYIYGLAKTQITPELNALSVVVMMASLLLLLIAYVATRGKLLNMSSGT